MSDDRDLVTIEHQTQELALPDKSTLAHSMTAVREFQHQVRELMIPDHDYGVIPNTKKPTLLKPGAEKIAKILGLADSYEVTSRVENWDKGFFAYEVRCELHHYATGKLVASGLGSCNSMESRYRYRWVNGQRVENDDIYTQVNTILKMARKRAMVDAALSAGRLSDIFTQDMEDQSHGTPTPPEKAPAPPDSEGAHWCAEHKTAWFKKGKMKNFAHPVGDTGQWCNEPSVKAPSATTVETTATPAPMTMKEFVDKFNALGLTQEQGKEAIGGVTLADYLKTHTTDQALEVLESYARTHGKAPPAQATPGPIAAVPSKPDDQVY